MVRTSVAAVVAAFCAFGCASGTDDMNENTGNSLGMAGASAGTFPLAGSAGTVAGTPTAGTTAGATAGTTAGTTVIPPIAGTTAGAAAGAAGAIAGTTAGTMPPVAGMAPPVAGTTAGMDMPVAGTGPVTPGVAEPTVPALTETCPDFRSGSISFMGLSGITVQAGTKASGPTAPMVFYWHGTGSFAGEYAGSAAAVHQGVMQEGGVLISFQGTTGGDLLSGTATFGRGDFELTDQLLACAVQNHNVDPHRIFSTGCSAGGLFANAMAAVRSSYIAAVAPNSGGWTVPVAFETDWTPALMTVHGAAGRDVVIIDFSTSSRTADTAFKGRGGFVINCDHGGGHCAGGGLAPDMWEFFKAHPYGTQPSPWTGGLPAGFNSDCAIF